MGNLGGAEFLVILFVALLVLGPDKLPEAARKIGDMVGQVRKISGSFQDEIRSAAMIDDIGLETTARERGAKAVAASKEAQTTLEPKSEDDETPGTPIENSAPLSNAGSSGPSVPESSNSIAAANASGAVAKREAEAAVEAAEAAAKAAAAEAAAAEAALAEARAALDADDERVSSPAPDASIEMESDR